MTWEFTFMAVGKGETYEDCLQDALDALEQGLDPVKAVELEDEETEETEDED